MGPPRTEVRGSWDYRGGKSIQARRGRAPPVRVTAKTVLMRLSPGANVALIKHLKGASAHRINLGARLPFRLGWRSGYWAESVAPCDASVLTAYISRQRQCHDDSHPAECWQMYDSSQRE